MVKLLNQDALTDERWQAIINNNALYDGKFYYAVKTTGIFCRPSCKSRPPKRENISIFLTTESALIADYRSCKRCKPTGQRLPDDEWINLVTRYIDKNYMHNLSLHLLAEVSHGSPYHLHRIFKRVIGMTPVEYMQQLRIEHAKGLLVTTKIAISDVGQCVGLGNPSYFITLFKKITGCTPARFRQIHSSEKKGEM